MIKPVGARVVLRADIVKNGEKEEISQEAKVIDSNVEGLKKGDVVFFNPNGAVSVNSMTTKKNMILICDAEDIYGKI